MSHSRNEDNWLKETLTGVCLSPLFLLGIYLVLATMADYHTNCEPQAVLSISDFYTEN